MAAPKVNALRPTDIGAFIAQPDGRKLTITQSGSIRIDSVAIPNGKASAAVAYTYGVVWGQEATTKAWWIWIAGRWIRMASAPTGLVFPPPPPPPPPAVPGRVLAPKIV